jgi:ATPase subunit of ABC transporter with duplicated ATPase domains
MIADITVTEKSFGPKLLMHGIKFSIDDGEKVGVIGRNGVGKSTLFGILAETDQDFTGDIIYRRGTVVVATAQEHHGMGDTTVLQYVLAGLPEYPQLSHIIETYPDTMGDDMKKIEQYTAALQRFDDKGFYQIEEQIERELENFQLSGIAHRPFSSLSGGQKRLVEVVKIMHSDAHLALVDEPTNHMDYIAKAQFVDWMRSAREAVLVITHDRDVLREVDRIIELKDGESVSYKGNYDAYLKQNAVSTGSQMNEFEMIEKRIANLKVKVLDYQRLKEKSRNPGTIQKFKRLEEVSRKELADLQAKEKPTFWIDKESAANLNYKTAAQYDKFKAKNIRMNLKNEELRSKHVLVNVKDLSLGYGDTPLFSGVNIDLREGEAMELRGRNGAGKTTLIKALLGDAGTDYLATVSSTSHVLANAPTGSGRPEERQPNNPAGANTQTNAQSGVESSETSAARVSADAYSTETRSEAVSKDSDGAIARDHKAGVIRFSGDITLDKHMRIGIYEQEVSPTYFDLPLQDAIERMYLDRNLPISTTKIRGLMSDYLFTEGDGNVPLSKLSGGQKARFQLISMLANDPQLLILDEPTNHLDLPSIEELETALAKYSGAVLYVSHDGYFRDALQGEVVQIGN